MDTFKQITDCIERGGHVQEFSTQLDVVAYIDHSNKKSILLGENKAVYLEIQYNELDERDLEFIFLEKGEY